MTNKEIVEKTLLSNHFEDGLTIKEETWAYDNDKTSHANSLSGCVNMLWDTLELLKKR